MIFSTYHQLTNHKKVENHYVRKRPYHHGARNYDVAMNKRRTVATEKITSYFTQNPESDVWSCNYCGEVWDDENDDDGNRWIICDGCGKKYHLQCSGIQYREEEYYDVEIEGINFNCENCE